MQLFYLSGIFMKMKYDSELHEKIASYKCAVLALRKVALAIKVTLKRAIYLGYTDQFPISHYRYVNYC